MNSEKTYPLQAYLDIIGLICKRLDYIVSSNIEEQRLEGCIDPRCYIETLINSDETVSILGKTGLKALLQLDAVVPEGYCYCCRYRKEFSQTQRWFDFVDYANDVSILLKNAVKRYEEAQ